MEPFIGLVITVLVLYGVHKFINKRNPDREPPKKPNHREPPPTK